MRGESSVSQAREDVTLELGVAWACLVRRQEMSALAVGPPGDLRHITAVVTRADYFRLLNN